MTGLPCSGKTTIARKLREIIPSLALLDGDELREWLSPKDFSREGRNEHNKKVAYLSRLLITHNVPVCVSLISPYKENREAARKIVGNKNFFEIYINCPISECERRDNKGMYKKARKGQIKNFTGIDDVYEEPEEPNFILYTDKQSISDNIQKIISYFQEKKILEDLT